MEQEGNTDNLELWTWLNTPCDAEQALKITKTYLCQPVSNAAVECEFPLMNIKSDMRTWMNADLPDASLAVKLNGTYPNSMSIDSTFFQGVENDWKNQKKRLYALWVLYVDEKGYLIMNDNEQNTKKHSNSVL